MFALLKLLLFDKISCVQCEECKHVMDIYQILYDKFGECVAISLIYNNLKLLKAEAALECVAGVSSVDVEQTPYDVLVKDIVQILLIVGDKHTEKLICYLAKVYLDDPHPDHVKDWGVLGVFSQLIDRMLVTPENGTDLLLDGIQQVFPNGSILERCRKCLENDLSNQCELCHYDVTQCLLST